MNLDRVRLRLTIGYVGIFSLILLSLIMLGIAGFLRELIIQQDELLTQEARNQAANLLGDGHREVLAEGSDEYGWAALELDGRVLSKDSAASYLGLPHPERARDALREEGVVPATIRGPEGKVRVVSMPMYESGEVVGVIQYARSLEAVQETVKEHLIVLLPLVLGGLGLAAVGGMFMAGRAVRPVQEAFERQRTFIADASHELKTPLTLIRANTEILQRGLTDPDERELADDTLTETDRMSALLSDLLLAARLDAGKLAIAREVFDVMAVVSNVVDRFATWIAAKNIKVEVQSPGELVARGDPARTEQILVVLLDNALTYTPPEGSVTITGRSRDHYVETTVRDTGPGIAPEHLPRVFERFYRADSSRNRAEGGTGLGLAIARDLARAQKGDLGAENVKAGGAAFTLKVPAA